MFDKRIIVCYAIAILALSLSQLTFGMKWKKMNPLRHIESSIAQLKESPIGQFNPLHHIESSITQLKESPIGQFNPLQHIESSIAQYNPFQYMKETITAEEYLNSKAITYGTLKNIAQNGNNDIINFVANPQIDDNTKIVRVGFHGTTYESAISIARNGIRPSAEGLMGVRVYTTPLVSAAAFFALLAHMKQGNGPLFRQDKPNSICHMFTTVEDAQNLQLFRVKFHQYHKLIQEKLNKGLNFPYDDHVVVSKKGGVANFPGEDSGKLIAFCEPFSPDSSEEDFVTALYLLQIGATLRWQIFETEMMRKFQENSLLKNIETIDMTKLAKLTDQRVKDIKSIPKADRCEFCKLQRQGKEFDYESENILIIKDHNPQAEHHMLAIPKAHNPSSVADLTGSDIHLVRDLKQACDNYFDQNNIDRSGAVYGFHIPNFASVGHLHLHCLIPPLTGLGQVKYDERYFPFITYDNLIRKLENGEQVKRITHQKVWRKAFVRMMKQQYGKHV